MEEHKKDIVHVGPASLQKVNKHISVAKKVLFEDITDDFNRAFCLLYPRLLYPHLIYDEIENHLNYLETRQHYGREMAYSYAFLTTDQYDKVLSTLRKNITLIPTHYFSYILIGQLHCCAEEFHESIEAYTKAIEIEEGYPYSYFLRGHTKMNLKDFEGAILDFSESLSLDPLFTGAYIDRGRSKYEMGNYQGAEEDYTKAIEIEPNCPAPYYVRGQLRHYLGWKGAKEDARKYRELDEKLTANANRSPF